MTTDTLIQCRSQTHIGELESIRGLAALLVVFVHFPKWNSSLDIGIVNNGYLMVELFFVLSGYVIYNAYGEKISNGNDLFRFQFLRFGRLYPVHLVFLIVFIFIEVAKYIAQSKFGIASPNTQPFRENNLTAIFQQIFLVQAIGPTHNATTFNGPAWSISVEFYTYLIFGLIILCAPKRKLLSFLVIATLSLVLLGSQRSFGFEELLRCLAGFFIGCLTAIFTKARQADIPKHVSLSVFILIVLFLQLKPFQQYDVVMYFLSAVLIASLVLSKDGYLNYILKLKILTFLGSISYALYMSHAALIWILNQVIRIFLKRPEALISGKSVPQLGYVETLVACGLLTLLVLSVSILVYKFIELPMRQRSRLFALRIDG